MKKELTWVSIAVVVLLCSTGLLQAAEIVKLQVLNPRGEITLPPVLAPSARVPGLTGKKIGLYWNGKAGGNNFWNQIEALLKSKLPGSSIVRYEGPFDLKDDFAKKIAGETDAFLYGVGD